MWYEGMPLDPCVFQQEYLHLMDTLAYTIESTNSNNWGVTKLKIDEEKISEGMFGIKELECLMPDYSPIIFNADNASEESKFMSINLKDHTDELKNKDLFIFLTLPNNALAYDSNISKARYKTYEVESIKDLNKEGNESTISFLKPSFELMLSEIPILGSICMPVAKINFNGLNFQLAEYAPPTLNLKCSPLLIEKLEKLIKSGREKLRYLTNKNDDSLENKFLIMNLAKICFKIEAILRNNENPYKLFLALVDSLSNTITFFKENTTIPVVPAYNHLDHLSSISPLINYINKGMDSIKESYKREEFKEQEGVFGVILSKEIENEEKITIGVTKKANNTLEDTNRWIKNAIITTEDKLTQMQDQRVTGAKRILIKYSDKLDLKETPDMLLVEITLNPSYITPNKMLCIMNFEQDNTPEKIHFFMESKA